MALEITVVHFDKTNQYPLAVRSRFERHSDGQLAHYTDDKLRAIVPPESWDDYAKDWPECQPLVDELKKPTAAADLQDAVNTMLAASENMPVGGELILPAAE